MAVSSTGLVKRIACPTKPVKGFAGKDSFEEAVIDSLIDQYTDYKNEIKPFIYAFLGFAPGDVDKLKKETFMPSREKFLGFVTKFLKKNASR
ncbi:hypothetical protein KIN20_030300, partial [Parelaphostrongylus tenuis]